MHAAGESKRAGDALQVRGRCPCLGGGQGRGDLLLQQQDLADGLAADGGSLRCDVDLERATVALAAVASHPAAVISTLGVGTSRAPTVLYSAGVANVLAAMRARPIERLVVVSAAPVGPPDEHPLLQRRLVLPILRRLFGATYEDMQRMEDALRASEADWVSLRPPRLVEKAGEAGYRIQADSALSGARSLRYVDLAAALLDLVSDRTLTCTAAYIAH